MFNNKSMALDGVEHIAYSKIIVTRHCEADTREFRVTVQPVATALPLVKSKSSK